MWSRGIICLLFANILGGASYAGMQFALLHGLPEITIIFLRTVVSLACFIPLLKRDSLRWPFRGRDLALILLVGVGGYTVPLTLGIIGLKQSTVANASILVLLEPIGIVLLGAIFLRERARLVQVLGIVVGFTGACLVILSAGEKQSLLAGPYLRGNVILAIHGFLWSVFTIAAKPLLKRHTPLAISYAASLVTIVMLAPLTQLEAPGISAVVNAPLAALLWVVALGVLVSFGSTLLWIEGVRLVKPVIIAGFVFIQPIVGALLGSLVFGNRLTGSGLLGGALICVAVLLVALGETTRTASEQVNDSKARVDHAPAQVSQS